MYASITCCRPKRKFVIYLTWLRLTCFYNLKFIDTATLPYELPYELPNIQQIKNDNENKKTKKLKYWISGETMANCWLARLYCLFPSSWTASVKLLLVLFLCELLIYIVLNINQTINLVIHDLTQNMSFLGPILQTEFSLP